MRALARTCYWCEGRYTSTLLSEQAAMPSQEKAQSITQYVIRETLPRRLLGRYSKGFHFREMKQTDWKFFPDAGDDASKYRRARYKQAAFCIAIASTRTGEPHWYLVAYKKRSEGSTVYLKACGGRADGSLARAPRFTYAVIRALLNFAVLSGGTTIQANVLSASQRALFVAQGFGPVAKGPTGSLVRSLYGSEPD